MPARGIPTTLCPSPSTRRCSGRWHLERGTSSTTRNQCGWSTTSAGRTASCTRSRVRTTASVTRCRTRSHALMETCRSAPSSTPTRVLAASPHEETLAWARASWSYSCCAERQTMSVGPERGFTLSASVDVADLYNGKRLHDLRVRLQRHGLCAATMGATPQPGAAPGRRDGDGRLSAAWPVLCWGILGDVGGGRDQQHDLPWQLRASRLRAGCLQSEASTTCSTPSTDSR